MYSQLSSQSYKEDPINGYRVNCQEPEGILKWTKLPPFICRREARLLRSPQRHLGTSSCHFCVKKRLVRVTTKNYLDLPFHHLSLLYRLASSVLIKILYLFFA